MSEAEKQLNFDAFLLLVGKLSYVWTNTESLLIHLIAGLEITDVVGTESVFFPLHGERDVVESGPLTVAWV